MELQAIYVRSHQERTKPEPHIAYAVEVHVPSRTWTVYRRYSEFETLCRDIEHEIQLKTGKGKGKETYTLPDLPPKRATLGSVILTPWRGLSGNKDAEFVQERQAGLERWLRSIVGAKDGEQVRQTHAFKAFLELSASSTSTKAKSAEYAFTSQTWLEEHQSCESVVKDIQAQLNRRDSLSDRGDSTASHQANVEAKKLLASLMNRISILAKGLDELGMSKGGLSEGEMRRRTDMVAKLQDRAEVLGKMALATNARTRGASARETYQTPDSTASRNALLGQQAPGSNKPVTRVLGQKAKPVEETSQTRALDNSGLLQLQMQEIDQVSCLEWVSWPIERPSPSITQIGILTDLLSYYSKMTGSRA
jgi:regulator of vacuolar morphogenesis